jgi:hypothetical protein
MEKTTSTTAIIKGSMSETADVDLQILRCRRCLHLLVPPVLQVPVTVYKLFSVDFHIVSES